MNIICKKTKINNTIESNNILCELTELSKLWSKEESCSFYNANDNDYYINRELYTATINGKLIAYLLGDIKTLTEESSYNKIGEIVFEVDELYVLPQYRNQDVGKFLFNYATDDLKNEVNLIALQANSQNYLKLLNFYINKLEMDFIYALLTKRL